MEHWQPNRDGRPSTPRTDDETPRNGPRPRAPQRVIDRWKQAALVTGFRSTAAWMVSRLQIAADLDLRGEE
jgi:hypothetical protein